MHLQQAEFILEAENYFKKNGAAYSDFFLKTENSEQTLTDMQYTVYHEHQKRYGLARQNYLAEKTDENAQRFVDACQAYALFKQERGFLYLSCADFYQQTIVNPSLETRSNPTNIFS